ncbi:hypothetical protein BMI76_01855 [Streptococcus sp. 'caviae']|nr:hypothetical protein BMI76_01855 [Streptococcus sp. 'caviae']
MSCFHIPSTVPAFILSACQLKAEIAKKAAELGGTMKLTSAHIFLLYLHNLISSKSTPIVRFSV